MNKFRLPAPKFLLPFLIIILILVALRVALPYVLLHYVNGYLKDVHLWRGAYELKGTSLERTTGIVLDHVYVEADNLTNTLKLNNENFATIKIYNKVGENDPKVNVDVSLDSFARHPTALSG